MYITWKLINQFIAELLNIEQEHEEQEKHEDEEENKN